MFNNLEDSDIFIAILSTFLSSIAALIASNYAIKQSNRNAIFAKRVELYQELIKITDELINYSFKIFEEEYIDNLILNKAKVKLWASNAVHKRFEQVFLCITENYSNYKKFCEDENPENNPRAYRPNEEGLEDCQLTPNDFDVYEEKCGQKKEQILDIFNEKYVALNKNLITQIRKEMGSDK